MDIKLSQPECSLITLQFQIDKRLMDFIWQDDDTINKFKNWMQKVRGLESATFHPFMGLYVWCSFSNPHGRLILSHEVARDAIVAFQKKFIEDPAAKAKEDAKQRKRNESQAVG